MGILIEQSGFKWHISVLGNKERKKPEIASVPREEFETPAWIYGLPHSTQTL
jgi:hypothetical protein